MGSIASFRTPKSENRVGYVHFSSSLDYDFPNYRNYGAKFIGK